VPVAEEAAVTAEIMGNSVERVTDVGVAGVHRLFSRLEDIQRANVVIVVAGMEGALQMDHAIVPLLEARMNDATNSMIDALAYSLYNNTSNNQQLLGLPAAIDDGTNTATYGNINRTANPWWQAKWYATSGYLTRIPSCGEKCAF
jgi:hypothetical protein